MDERAASRRQARQTYLAAEADSSDPLHRVVMLHAGAARFLCEAIRAIGERDFEKAHHGFHRARQIVLHFLASIPEEDESDLAAHLRGLFQFAVRQISEANLRKDIALAEAALRVLRTLGEGWAELDAQRR